MPNSLADRATSDNLIGPDWAMNLEICDILNHDPGQAREFVKGLKKRIRSKNPKVQLLTLTLLETVVKNCSAIVHMQIADKNIPHEMVRIVKKKPDFHVKEKILVLINTWQEAFGGPQGRFPQFFMAYHDLLRAGIVFPKHPVKSTPIFTATPTMRNHDKKTEKLEASGDSEIHVLRYEKPEVVIASGKQPAYCMVLMAITDIQNARVIMDVLVEMLNALESRNKEGVKQEVIVELVEQCRLYRQRVVHLVNSTSEEELLCEGLALNDDLQNVLSKYDAIVIEVSNKPKKQKSLQALVDIDDKNQDDDNESDLRENAGGRRSNQVPLQQLSLPAPPSSPRSGPHLDLLSGEEFGAALLPANEATASSAEEQNMLVLSGSSNCADHIAFSAEQAYTVASPFQLQQQSLPYLDGRAMNHGQSIYEQASFVQRAQLRDGDSSWNNHIVDTGQQESIGAVDQGGDLPPPPWEIELAESSQQLTLQQRHLQTEQTREIITYSPRIQENQPMEIYSPHDQAYYLSNAYSQSMQGGQMTGYNYGQPSESPLYGYNASYSYSNTNELSHGLYGLSLQDRYMNAGHSNQMPSTSSSSYLQQPVKQLKAEDNLFGDLVSMAKSKTNKPAN